VAKGGKSGGRGEMASREVANSVRKVGKLVDGKLEGFIVVEKALDCNAGAFSKFAPGEGLERVSSGGIERFRIHS